MQDDVSNPLKGLHDQLLEEMPEGATHDRTICLMCAQELIDNQGAQLDDFSEGGSMSKKTYTLEELKAAFEVVAEARKAGTPVTAQQVDADVAGIISLIDEMVDELMDRLGIADTDSDAGPGDTAALAAANKRIAELESKVKEGETAELQKQLDAAVLERQTAMDALEAFKAEVEADKVAAEEAAAMEARKTDRLARVGEFNFPEPYVADNSDRWVGLSDEEFEKVVADWESLGAKKEAKTTIPAQTAMTASRESADNNNGSQSHLGTIMELRRTGSDPRTL